MIKFGKTNYVSIQNEKVRLSRLSELYAVQVININVHVISISRLKMCFMWQTEFYQFRENDFYIDFES